MVRVVFSLIGVLVFLLWLVAWCVLPISICFILPLLADVGLLDGLRLPFVSCLVFMILLLVVVGSACVVCDRCFLFDCVFVCYVCRFRFGW